MENDNHISGFIRGNRLARAGQPWTWGYVIFRTVYTAESDEHWASVLSKLEGYLFRELEHPLWWDYRSLAPEDIRAYPAPPQADPAVFEDFRKRLQHQIIDDKATLDGLSIVEVRQKFIDFESSIPVVKRMSLKSEWCLMIDNEVLKSIIAAPEPTRRSPEDMCLARGPGQPFIKVVAKDSGAGSDDPDYEGWMLASLNYLWALYQVNKDMDLLYPHHDLVTGECDIHEGQIAGSRAPSVSWEKIEREIAARSRKVREAREEREMYKVVLSNFD